jgi:hypothetical protein
VIIGLLATNLSFTNVNALDLSEFGIGDKFGQDVNCVIVVVGCDGTGSVGSSGDTAIGSSNDNGNDDDTGNNNGGGGTNEPPTGTLNAIKITECNDENSTAPGEVCSQIADNNQPQDWSISVFGNDPTTPINTFQGSESGVATKLHEGPYSVDEEHSTGDIPQVSRNDVKNVAQFSSECEGSIESGAEITCTITNTLIYTAQTTTLIVNKIVNCDNSQSPPDVKCEDVNSFFNPGYFKIIVTGQNANPSTFYATSQGTTVTLESGSYSVSEDTSLFPKSISLTNSGQSIDTVTADIRTPQFSTDCSGTIEAGETKTCTITNTVFIYRL